jgi:endoglucanase
MKLLKQLCQMYSPSGNEEIICDFLIDELKPYVDEIKKDALGNVIAHKKGNGKKLMLASHVDEIGVAVTFIDDNGFLRFAPVGGVDPIFSLYQSVEFKNGVKGVVSYEEDIDSVKNVKFGKMFIDIGAKNKEEAENKISIGDFACFTGEFIDMGDKVSSKALDNRVGVYVLIETAKKIKNTSYDLYFVFTTQEEVGLRGAKTSAYAIEPDIAIAIDVTDTGDTPNCKIMDVKLGGGVAIKVKDSSVICDKEIRQILENTAKKHNISYQKEVLAFGGTDAGAIHITKYGIKTGALSIPVRYMHANYEIADTDDMENAAKLIATFAASLKEGDCLCW